MVISASAESSRFDAQAMNLESTGAGATASAPLHQREAGCGRAQARAQASNRQAALDAAQTATSGHAECGNVSLPNAVYSAIRDHANSIIDFVQDVIALKRQTGTLTPGEMLTLNRWLTAPDPAFASTQSTLGR